jgi:RNA recognition motif-containing protein
MSKKLYVGNLPYSADNTDLENIFNQVGRVTSARVIIDRETGRSKGFGFVEMSSEAEAVESIERLDGVDYGGRPMSVSLAKPMSPREAAPVGSSAK